MKLTATLTKEEVVKLITGYVKKKTGKPVTAVDILDEDVIVTLKAEDEQEEE